MLKIFRLLDINFKIYFYFLVFLMFLSSGLEIISVSLIIPIIYSLLDSSLYNKYFFIKYFDQFPIFFENKLYLFLILFVIFFLIKNFFLLYYHSHEGKFIYNNQENISKRLLKFYLYKNYGFHVENNSADFINKISKESNQFSNALNSYVVLFSEILLLLSVSFFILLLFFKEFIIILFSIIFFSLILFFLFSKRIKKIGQLRLHYEYLRTKNLQEIFGAIKEIKFNKNEFFFLNQYSFISDCLSKLYSSWHFFGRLPRIYYETLILILISLILFLMVISEKSTIDIIAFLGTFIVVAFRIVPSANKIVSSINTFKYSKAAIDSLYSLLIENFEKYKEKKDINIKKSFSLKNLYFKYLSKENYIFQNMNFEIRNGDHICIYGDSGIGKSSLIDIILGLKEPVKGEIFIDNKKVDYDKYTWSSSMAYVPQDIYLLDQSIAENIALGIDKKLINYNLIYKSLKISRLDEFVELLPDKLNTITGEKGIQLSGGQKQRFGIARAIYRDAQILILDEATNALDSQLEEDFIKSLLLEFKEKTVIMITHKLNLMPYFSRKIKIQDRILIEKN